MQSPESNIDKDPYKVKCHIRAQLAPAPLQRLYRGGSKDFMVVWNDFSIKLKTQAEQYARGTQSKLKHISNKHN